MSAVTLTDNILLSLARRAEATREFPFLNAVTAVVKRKGCKCKRSTRQVSGLNSARAAILQLPADRVARFKKLINPKISLLTIFYKNGRRIDKKVL